MFNRTRTIVVSAAFAVRASESLLPSAPVNLYDQQGVQVGQCALCNTTATLISLDQLLTLQTTGTLHLPEQREMDNGADNAPARNQKSSSVRIDKDAHDDADVYYHSGKYIGR